MRRRHKPKVKHLSGEALAEAQEVARILAESRIPVEAAVFIMGDWLKRRNFAISNGALKSIFEAV